MHARLKCISHKKIRILILMRNFKIITFDTQDIYRNNISFKRAMADLRKLGLVVMRQVPLSKNEYKATDFGSRIGCDFHELAE